MDNNNFSVGIDLGVASVGWSVVNLDDMSIIDKGIVKFLEAQKAEDRRNARGLRRRYSRKHHRLERLKMFLTENDISLSFTLDNELLKKRIKGLKEQIDMQDLVNIMAFFAKHRGYIPFDNESRESEKIIEFAKEGLYPCQIQEQVLQKYGEYRGIDYPILNQDFINELRCILMQQKNYYPQITDEFVNEAINIINSKRKFWEGPGGPKANQLTPYGRYTNNEDLEEYSKNKEYNKYLYEKLIGKCSIYKDEKKASMASCFAEEFNFFNDFLNLRFDGSEINDGNKKYFIERGKDLYGFTSATVRDLEEQIINSSRVVIKEILKKKFGITKIIGNRIDSSGNIEISTFNNYRRIRGKFVDENLFEEIDPKNDPDMYNRIIYILQVSPSKDTKIEMLTSEFGSQLSNETIDILSEINLENNFHKFSNEALKKYISLMERENENSSYVERKFADEINSDVEKSLIENYLNQNVQKKNLKYINIKDIDNLVASPATKKSLRKAIGVLNKLINKYQYPKYVCIETTTSLLSEEKQKEYSEMMLDNTKKRENATKNLIEAGYEASEVNIIKQMLLDETQHKCIYCGKDINVNTCEIEHILPVSITQDDTYFNKTASCGICNINKNNRAPSNFIFGDTYKEFEKRVLDSNMNQKKKSNLLFVGDLNKYEKKFKNRNLNDTAYATTELYNQLQIFKKAYAYHNDKQLDMSVLKIPGQFTGMIRKKYNLIKDRSQEYHHAVDATIIASLPDSKIGKLMNLIQNNTSKFWENCKMDEYRENLMEQMYLDIKLKKELENTNFNNTRLSMQICKNPQGKISNANIYKGIKVTGTNELARIDQIDNIYNLKKSEVEKLFKDTENGKKKLLCMHNDIKMYEMLKEIARKYDNAKINPFIAYCIENSNGEITDKTFDYTIHGIRKNEKSPIIKRLRYYEKVTEPFLLHKSSINSKEDTLMMLHSLKQYCTRVYKHKTTQKLYFLPIYTISVDMRTKKVNENDNFYKQMYNKFVDIDINELDFYMDVFNNDYLRFEDNKGNKAEGYAQCFDKTSNKIVLKNTAQNITQKTVKIEKVNMDILGLYGLNPPSSDKN